MFWVDVAIIAVLVFTTVVGFRRGLLRQVVELLGLICGVFFGLYFTNTIVQNFTGPMSQFPGTPALVFTAIVILTLLISQILGRVASEIMEVTFFGWFDQVGGALAGFAKGTLWLSIVITVLMQLNLTRGFDDRLAGSTLAPPIAGVLPAAFTVVKAYAHDVDLEEPFQAAER